MLDKKFVVKLEDSVSLFSEKLYDEPERRERREEGNKEGGQGTHLPYGLCKKYGINLPKNATPKQAWAALKHMGVTPEETYESLEETGSVEGVESDKEEKQNKKTQQSVSSKLEEQGVDEELLNSIDISEVINYEGLDDLVSTEGFDDLPNDKKVAAVEEQQEQYINSLRYSKQRKDKARWFSGEGEREESYKALKPETWNLWQKLNEEQREALYNYTSDGYNDINGQLRGYKENTQYVQQEIRYIDEAMEQSPLTEDMWVTRGVGLATLSKFLGLEEQGYSDIYDVEDLDFLVGLQPADKGYLSCSANKVGGFSENVRLNIFVPKGTHAIYLAPISHFGGRMGAPGKKWDGSDTYIGSENEILLDRNLKFEVTKVYREGNMFYLDLEVIS